ncbi:MAG TPA: NAD(P)/FAD-dependent oxidoreductase [Solirubrobacteraceae bacterium]|nr:NAD(P)/FAD-dependent oxidoreductase [Solirubrobacteraceae bacterium]
MAPGGRVVVVGGGFGGLEAAKALGRAGADVTLVDRHNYHLFQPLTYQVATGGLAPGDIAVPLRHILRSYPTVDVLLGEMTGLDVAGREVTIIAPADRAKGSGVGRRIPYDALIVAGGSDYSYFGHEEWRSQALEVKSLDSALEVRGRILTAFESAEERPEDQEGWLTFVVVGAGPTGVEMAGQIAELARQTLPPEFRHIDPSSARVLLVETGDRVLAGFPGPLPERAARALERLGVTLVLKHTVVDVQAGSVELSQPGGGRQTVPTRTVVWAAGVAASPLAALLATRCGAETDRAGRVTVNPDLSLPGHPDILALGDMVRVRDPETGEARALPGLAPVAMQQGRYAGRVVAARLGGGSIPGPFHYRDKGTLATIGRASAVADVQGLRFSGFPAWLAWLTIHIFYLIGFENRAVVLLRWAYSYITRGRGNRLITHAASAPPRARVAQRSDPRT